MPLVDYESDADEDANHSSVSSPELQEASLAETPVSQNAPQKPDQKPAPESAPESGHWKITPAGSHFKGEKTDVDLSVLLALRQAPKTVPKKTANNASGPTSSKRSLDLPAPAPKRKLELAPQVTETKDDPEPATKPVGFNALDFYNQSLSEQHLQDRTPVHAVGSGRHQLTSLVRNAQDNKAALEQSFAQNRQTRKSARQKYGF